MEDHSKRTRMIVIGAFIIVAVFVGYLQGWNPQAIKMQSQIKDEFSILPLLVADAKPESAPSSGRKFASCYVDQDFHSTADYAEVKQFFTDNLTALGWTLQKETPSFGSYSITELTFVKDDRKIIIDYSEKAGWRYSVWLQWGS